MNAKIKILIAGLLFVMACGGGDDGSDGSGGVTELSMGVTATDTIGTVGEVDTYHLQVADTNRYLEIECDEKTSGSGVDVLVTVFEEDEDGERTRLFGMHKPLDATPPANIDMTLYIDEPKDLYITVRDVMDDDANQDIGYHLTCTLYDSADGNHDFENAVEIGASNEVFYDTIEDVGEVDCFTFSPDVAGVYSVTVAEVSDNFPSNIQLESTLYDTEGVRIQRVTDPDGVILSYLDPADGPFYITVHDNDDSDEDASAIYSVAVASETAEETMENDNSDSATVLTEDSDGFTATGEAGYASSSMSESHDADVDWYVFTVDPGSTTYQAVDVTISGDTDADASLALRVEVYNDSFNIVMSKDFYCSGDAYQNMFRAVSGDYYLSVTPLNPSKLDKSAEYEIVLAHGDLTDDDENTQNTAITLTPDTGVTGSIGYQADVDWYEMDVYTSSAKIVSVDLIADDKSVVDYQLSIWLGDTQLKKVSDLDGTDVATHLKTSIYVPAGGTSPATYYFKVGDGQNDEGSDVEYTITAKVEAVPTAAPSTTPSAVSATGDLIRYYNEIDDQSADPETDEDYTDVELEIFSSYQPHYNANNDWLDFKSGASGIATALQGDGSTLITFPWVAGYIDYQGDRDMFQLDFDKLNSSDTEWYYDIQIQLVASASDVEYVWKLYRDSNQNGIIMDDPTSDDGYKACAGDTTISAGAIDITTPSGGDEDGDGENDIFYIGSEWGEDETFYLGVQDFEYETLPSGVENTDPDDDWGYDDIPYYFQIQLIYHPGDSSPE
jgi:hypothetical protein